ncbi:glycosyltransferase family 2 protein [Chloroflexota bacterium]
MKVSVIVPTYNRAHMVIETVDLILNQTFKDFELIVVDNESTDNTEEVIKSYTDERIRYFKHQNNGVVAINRNYGINKAQGQYIAFCDDDDLWIPEKLERQMLEFEKDSQVGLICTNAINFDRHGEHGERIKAKLKDSHFTFESLMRGNVIVGSSVLLKRQVVDDVGMIDESPEIFVAEDYELWLRVAKKYRIKYIDLPLIKCRIHTDAHGSKYRTHAGARESKECIEARELAKIELNKAVYRKLLNKGIIDSNLYQKRISRTNRQILIQKLPGYKWVINGASFLKRIFHIIADGMRKTLGGNRG